MGTKGKTTFSVGDCVRCVNPGAYTGQSLTEGRHYFVTAVQADGFVEFAHSDNNGVGFDYERFELAAPRDGGLLQVSDTTQGGLVVVPAVRLPTTAAARKAVPICTGFLDYFPDAVADVARLSKIGNDQHNPGEPLHWARGKSMDQADCILRHMMDRGTVDTDGVLHDAKVAWRALAQLQLAIEKLRAEGISYPPVSA